MSETREVQIEPELNTLLDALDGSPDSLINHLLADYFSGSKVDYSTGNGKYVSYPHYREECSHEEHSMFNYCPYTPKERWDLGERLS